jgi:glycosyltransferase involved in cell wall biosynthesis
VPAILARSDVLLVTSDHEGFPNVVLEAMAAGIPVVTTEAGDAGVVVDDGVTGFVVRAGGEAALAEKLLELLRAPESAKAMGLAGRRRVESDYGLDGLADRLLEVYSELARRARRTSLQVLIARHQAPVSTGAGCA